MPLRNNLWNRIGALANAARKLRANFEGNGIVTATLDGILRDLSASNVGEGTITASLTKIKQLQAAMSGSGVLTADLANFDIDAQAFIDAAGITGETQQSALNQLVLDLKGSGSTTNNTDVWSNIQAVYPFCPTDGSTATRDAYKWNLKDPRDLDAAFRISWMNDPTAAVSGISGNGSNQYGNTHFNPSISGTLNNSSIGIYKDNNWNTLSNFYGVRDGGGQIFGGLYSTATNQHWSDLYNTASGRLQGNISNLSTDKYRIITSRTSSSSHVIYENGSNLISSSTSGGSLPNLDFYIMQQNNFGGFDNSTYQFFTIGLGLTANQAKDLDDAITTYNTALGR